MCLIFSLACVQSAIVTWAHGEYRSWCAHEQLTCCTGKPTWIWCQNSVASVLPFLFASVLSLWACIERFRSMIWSTKSFLFRLLRLVSSFPDIFSSGKSNSFNINFPMVIEFCLIEVMLLLSSDVWSSSVGLTCGKSDGNSLCQQGMRQRTSSRQVVKSCLFGLWLTESVLVLAKALDSAAD